MKIDAKIERLFSTEEQEYFNYFTLYNAETGAILKREKVDLTDPAQSITYNGLEFINIPNIISDIFISLSSVNNLIDKEQISIIKEEKE